MRAFQQFDFLPFNKVESSASPSDLPQQVSAETQSTADEHAVQESRETLIGIRDVSKSRHTIPDCRIPQSSRKTCASEQRTKEKTV